MIRVLIEHTVVAGGRYSSFFSGLMKIHQHFSIQLALACLAALGLVWLTGCTTRSISNSGYRGGGGYYGNSMYRGELTDFDVLGVDRDQTISEVDIGKALDSAGREKLRRGSSVLLIQSGAMFPDEPMASELNRYLNVVPFTGVPTDTRRPGDSAPDTMMPANYSKSLRLAAARGGCENILCYWGVLESAREGLASKSLSWVPVVGWVVPDERQHMRIRLKIAIVDVRTGHWSMLTPEPFEDKSLSGLQSRENSDQRQVETLKRKAYETAARDLLRIYGG